jgi:hypothetical protein
VIYGYDPEELKRNPVLQFEDGARYLNYMLDAHGNVPDALAAYNWGQVTYGSSCEGRKRKQLYFTKNVGPCCIRIANRFLGHKKQQCDQQ